MGKAPCCDRANVKRGSWSPEEDHALRSYVEKHGSGGNWISLPRKAGLRRCGKSCRLRWLNYLRPDIKHGGYTEEEEHIICSLYKNIGSRWSVIASKLPGRTDNDVKNYWNTKLKKKMAAAAEKKPCGSSTTISDQEEILDEVVGLVSYVDEDSGIGSFYPESPSVVSEMESAAAAMIGTAAAAWGYYQGQEGDEEALWWELCFGSSADIWAS